MPNKIMTNHFLTDNKLINNFKMLPENKKSIPLRIIIDESISGNTRMQELLYKQHAVSMYYVCLRYVKNIADAEDVLQEGFIKVFKNLAKYKEEGSFEGWVRKIITRTAISYLRDNKKHSCHAVVENTIADKQSNIIDKLTEKEIVGMVTKLPAAAKQIFMLHVIEGYNHREIAAMLGCNESTSKSQYYRSRVNIQKLLKQSA